MDIPLNAKVQCTDGDGGHSICVIIDPTKDQVTHLVVKGNAIYSTDHLVPIHFILETSQNRIMLRCSLGDLEKMEPFTEEEFVPYYVGGGYMWPYYSPAEPSIFLQEHERIPLNELAIRRGNTVHAADGPVGRVDEFIVDTATDSISHLVMREGHLWGQKDVTIPVSQIDRFENDEVFLKITRHQIESMPTVPVKRSK